MQLTNTISPHLEKTADKDNLQKAIDKLQCIAICGKGAIRGHFFA